MEILYLLIMDNINDDDNLYKVILYVMITIVNFYIKYDTAKK